MRERETSQAARRGRALCPRLCLGTVLLLGVTNMASADELKPFAAVEEFEDEGLRIRLCHATRPAPIDVGRFLGPSISGHYRRYPLPWTVEAWRRAGFTDVGARVMSLGGGLVMWGTREGG